jgi:hypothetical protein
MITQPPVGVSPEVFGVTQALEWEVGGMHIIQESPPLASARAFVAAWSAVWLYFCSLDPYTFSSRLPPGHLCCLGTKLLHMGLVLKVSVLPALLGAPALGSCAWLWCSAPAHTGSANMQKFIHIFCCFIHFRYRQSSPSLCL